MKSKTGQAAISSGIRLRHVLEGHEKWIKRIAWSPDGRLLASPSEDNTIRLWDIEDGSQHRLLKGRTSQYVLERQLDGEGWELVKIDSRHVLDPSLVHLEDKKLYQWEIKQSIPGTDRFWSVAWSPEGRTLAAASDDCAIWLWDLQTGERRRTESGHSPNATGIGTIAWSPDGRFFASGSDDTDIGLWEAETEKLHRVLKGHDREVVSVVWSPDSAILASGSRDKTIRLWNVETAELLQTLEGHSDVVWSLAWHPKGCILASASEDSTIQIWDPETGTRVKTLREHVDAIVGICFSSDSQLFASKSLDGTVKLWRTDTWQVIGEIPEKGTGDSGTLARWYSGIAFHPCHPVLATLGGKDDVIRIWDLDYKALGLTSLVSPSIPIAGKRQPIHILNLSDLHIGTKGEVEKYKTQLELDLLKELEIERLEYLVLSGDIARRSAPQEYEAAQILIDRLVDRFQLGRDHIIVVPGNHDLRWDLSEQAYRWVPKRRLSDSLPEEQYIDLGSEGALVRDEDSYRKRFTHFRSFYREVCGGTEYPSDYNDQGIILPFPEHQILFLGLNSCWRIDHHPEHHSLAGIHEGALARALTKLADGDYDDWLKIAVWHHPVTGIEMMNDEFLEQLAVARFQICMHGHVHVAKRGLYTYDETRGLHIVGAGTFGAPAREQVSGIPLQYNLLKLDPDTRTITVETRRKEKPDGAWSADARWVDKENPKPRYTIELEDWTFSRGAGQ